ncbi:MAG TPA: ferritin-like domain-containing protein, partial [Rhizomicrobium sp.]|nr:ferritin-like domain-containing protein [Rhizomicrobium sp.]
MADGVVYSQGWTLDDIRWEQFDATRVEPSLLAALKAASLVEYNAPDYVIYLKRVFAGSDARTLADIEQWGIEETQHGLALGRWCELADPSFDFEVAFARFRAGYRPAHFESGEGSIRGSKRSEMIARCVVESGTSSFYSAIRDAADEPVLKEVAGRIAADEFRHYKLFYETLNRQDEVDPPFWRKLLTAVSRVNESDDDELSYAYYCGNVPAEREAVTPYRREEFARAYHIRAMTLYRRHHVRKLVQMIAKAIGTDPQSRLTEAASALLWRMLRVRAGLLSRATRVPA